MTTRTVCIFGGSGFVGRRLVSHLANAGWQVRVPTRSRERHRQMLVMPGVQLRQHERLDDATLAQLLQDCDAAINLIGVLNGSEERLERVHAELPAAIVAACAATGVPRYLHMSALNAAPDAPSAYLRSKGRGVDAVFEAARSDGEGPPAPAVTSFHPSVIFGPGDGFFNRFAKLLKMAPALPLACPDARFAPVYLDDVVAAFAAALNDPATAGRRYQLCGPKIYTLKELVEYTAELIGKRRLVLGLSDKLSKRQGAVFDWLFRRLPGDPPFSQDNYLSMQVDSVCQPDAPGLAELGIAPTAVESVMPRLFGHEAARDRYQQFRRVSGR